MVIGMFSQSERLFAWWHLGATKLIPGGPLPPFKNFGSGIRFSMQDHAVLLKAFLLVYRFLTSDALHSAICTIGSRGVTSVEAKYQ